MTRRQAKPYDDHPARHDDDPLPADERRPRRPGMASVLLLLAATIASGLIAFGGLAGRGYAAVAPYVFFTMLALFVAASVARIAQLGERRR